MNSRRSPKFYRLTLALTLAFVVLVACDENSPDQAAAEPAEASVSTINTDPIASVDPASGQILPSDLVNKPGPKKLSSPSPRPDTASQRPIAGPATSITVGLFLGCALEEDGTPLCWNLFEEVGPIAPDYPPFEVPLNPPPGEESFVSISSGPYQTCGLRADGTPICWKTTSEPSHPAIAPPPAGEVLASIDSRTCYTCGLRPDGSPLCWAQVVDQDICDFELIPPPAGEKFIDLTGNDGFSCGLREDGSFVCYPDVQVPSSERGKVPQMPEGERFIDISHGNWSFCAISQSGTPVCWYFNMVAEGWARADDPDVGSMVSISTGAFHSCGLRGDGSPVCWGIMGNFNASSWPLEEERFVAIASSDFHSCGLRADRSHYCWAAPLAA